jgi:hypothetical protein
MEQNSIVYHKETGVKYNQISHKGLQSVSSTLWHSVEYLRFAVIHAISHSISMHNLVYLKQRFIMNCMKLLITIRHTATLGVHSSCVSDKLGINQEGVN